MEELVTEVDRNDRMIGRGVKADFYRTERIHRSSHLMLFNSKGELLIQRRAIRNRLYPGTYDFSVGGFVSAGETYKQAIERETQEELGISVTPKRLFKFHYFDEINKAFKTAFTAIYDGTFTIQKEELDSVKWVSPEQLQREMKSNPKKFNPSFIEGMRIFWSRKHI